MPRLTIRQVAADNHASYRGLKKAVAIRRYGVPALVAMVEAGDLKLDPAWWISRCDPEEQRKVIAQGPEHVRQVAGLLRRLVAERRHRVCRTCGQLIRRKRPSKAPTGNDEVDG